MINIDFDFNALRIFIAVYESGGIEKAGKRLFLTQPAVSIAIKKLEEKLNGKLFTRLSKGIKPTQEGERFYKDCKIAMNLLADAVTNFSPQNALQGGKLKIGASPSIIKYILMPAIKNFSHKYPNITISFTEVISSRLQRYLVNGDIDIAFMEEPIENIEVYSSHEVFSLNSCFIGANQIKDNKITTQNMQNFQYAVLKENTNNRKLFTQLCEKNNLQLKISYEMANFETLSEICKNNLALGFTFHEFIKNEIKNKDIKALKTNLTMPEVKVFALMPKGSSSFVCECFLNFLKQKV